MSKIIALLPYKNEDWVLKTFLSNVKRISDEIVCIDDLSTDSSNKIMEEGGAFMEHINKTVTVGWAEHNIRQRLLEIGRQRGGTHFICLDADEIFEDSFCKNGRNIILALKPGESLIFRWITVWKSLFDSRVDGVYKNLYKDFIFCDDGKMTYPYAFLGVKRTPASHYPPIKVDYSVIHLQYYNFKRNQIKQVWYMCSERVKNLRGVKRINLTYSIKNDIGSIKIESIRPDLYSIDFVKPDIDSNIKNLWHWKEVLELFDKYSIEFFEGLDIWNIEELHEIFIGRTHREPRIQKFSYTTIRLNEFRHLFFNTIRKLIKYIQ